MTVSDLDIERSASVLIASRGIDGAATHAAAMVVVMQQRGDDDGELAWRRIAAAIRSRIRRDNQSIH